MATWTKIPETNIAGTLGGATNKLMTSVSLPINKSLDKMSNRIDVLQQEADDLQKEIRVIQDKTEQIILEKESKNEMSSTGGGAYASFLQSATGNSVKGLQTKDTVDEVALLQETIARVNRKVSTFNRKSRSEVNSMRNTLNAANRSINTVLSILATLRAVVIALKVPIPPFEVLIKIIKLLPIPQRYLIVSFTILESDMLEMLEQLIAQAKEEITGIEALIKGLEGFLQPIRTRIEEIRARLNLISLDCITAGASTQDRRILDMYGYLDSGSGNSLLGKIQKGLAGQGTNLGGSDVMSYGVEGLDLTKPELANQLILAKPGDIVGVNGKPTGSFIQTWFCSSSEQPEVPAGFPRVSGSWVLNPDPVSNYTGSGSQPDHLAAGQVTSSSSSGNRGGTNTTTGSGSGIGSSETDIVDFSGTNSNLGTNSNSGSQSNKEADSGYWKVDLKVTGDGSIFGGLDSTPTKASIEDVETARRSNFDLGTEYFRVLDETNFDQKPGILKVSDWNSMMEVALTKMKDLPFTQDFKDELTNVWNEMVSTAKGNTNEKEVTITKFQWRSKSGDIYNLEIIEDEHSPKVAVRRFVRVTDQAGIVIMDGPKTFSIDTESLLQEIKLHLDQLTQ